MKNRDYLLHALTALMIFAITYFIIWMLFIANGPFKVGENLTKGDWLIFLGGFLSFVGTITISYVTILQNKNYHFIEQEKLRYSHLPYFKIRIADKTKLIPDINGNYLLDFVTLYFENDKFTWRGGEDSELRVLILKNQIDLAGIYEIKNIGLGHAMKLSLKSNNSEHLYDDHLKVDGSLFFIVDISSLKKESQKFDFYLYFFDIYNHNYRQKFVCEFNITGTQFKFTTSKDQFDPEFLKESPR